MSKASACRHSDRVRAPASMLDSKPSLAVCLAAYNGVRWLPKQIQTILDQKGVEVTLFISVDLSTDGTLELVDNMARDNPRIVILPYGVRFGGAARNFFRLLSDLDFARFQYVAFADQDDEWFDGKLKRAVETLERCRADGYSSNVTAFWDGGRRVQTNKAQAQREWDFLFESAGPGCTFVMRPELVQHVKDCLAMNSDEVGKLGLHDWFVYAFARANGFNWIIDEHSGLLYRQHGSNEIGVNAGWRAYLFRARKVMSGWGLNQSYLIARLVGLSGNPFVVKWSRRRWWELIWLAFQARRCRRRFRDQVLFFFSCIALAIKGGVTG